MVKFGPDLLSSGTDSYSGHLPNGNFLLSAYARAGNWRCSKVWNSSSTALGASRIRCLASPLEEPSWIKDLLVTSKPNDWNCLVKLVAGSRAGMYQYTFPESHTGNNVLIDMSHVLPSFRGQGLSQGYAGGNFTIMRDGHYEASGVYKNGWNRSPNLTTYSCTFIVLKIGLQLLTRSKRLLQCYAFSSLCVHRCRKRRK